MSQAFDQLLNAIGFPESTYLDKPLFKKMFLEHGSLGAADKKVLKEVVTKIRWLYTLKPSTINIAPYNDAEYDYSEIAVLQVETSSLSQAERIAEFINRAIPYPLVIYLTSDIDDKSYCNLCLADKRHSKADKDKWVIEELYLSGWIDLTGGSVNKPQQDFINSLKINELPFSDFRRFYQALIGRVIALKWAGKTGTFSLASSEERNLIRRKALKQYHELELSIEKLRRELTKSAFNRKVELNVQIKKYEQELKQLKESL